VVLKRLVRVLVNLQRKGHTMKDVIEVQDDSKYLGSNLPVTQQDFDALADQRKMLQTFVSKQLRKGVDYGVIPGTPKSSLFKPGAEKLKLLFGLGVRVSLVHRELDRRDNFAMFNYKAEVYHLKSGNVVAECEGSCNSQEKKYRERSVYEYNKQTRRREKVRDEATPVCDVANTLMKMAQKRAFVGAVILAVGASDFFTQDIDDPQDAETLNVTKTEETDASPIPGVTSAKSTDDAQVPTCSCGNKMMVSKYEDPQFPQGYFYCAKCKTKKGMAA
jgi:hypothetical protein